MNISDLFNHETVQKVAETLNNRCIEGQRLTRAELCAELGLIEPLSSSSTKEKKLHNLTVEAAVGSLLTLGIIPGFDAKKGPGGGIGIKGSTIIPADKKKKNIKRVDYPEGFLDNVKNALNTLCIGSVKIPRKSIINAIKLPDNVDMIMAVNLLSAAKAGGLLPGFGSSPGVGGGFYRLPQEGITVASDAIPATCEAPVSTETADAAEAITAAAGEEEIIITAADSSENISNISEQPTSQEVITSDAFLEGILTHDEPIILDTASSDTSNTTQEEISATTEDTTIVPEPKTNKKNRRNIKK
jgi:hypothetical protein